MEEPRATILVVDDEEAVTELVSRELESAGYECEVASDGKEALYKAFMQDFDLMLLDIRMPGLSGMDVLNKMVVDHPDTGVVMITAISETQTAVEAMKLGAFDYLTKPFNLDDLLVRVEKALERRRLILGNRAYQLRLEQKVTRQVGQIQQYHNEVLDALSREQKALEELEGIRRWQNGGSTESSEVEGALGMVRGFARRLSRLFRGGGRDSEERRGGIAQVSIKSGGSEEPQQGCTPEQEGEPEAAKTPD